jgi:hypothetical protein
MQVSSSNPAVLFIGARLVRNFRFIGEIDAAVVFDTLLTSSDIARLNTDFPAIRDPVGECTSYLGVGVSCPTPSVAPSLLCQSVLQL